jgi:hypothetical protein
MRISRMCGYCAQSCTSHVLTIRPGNTPYCSYSCAINDFRTQLAQGQRLWWDGATITEYHEPSTALTVLTEVLREKQVHIRQIQDEERIRQLQGECRVLQRGIEFMLSSVRCHHGEPK